MASWSIQPFGHNTPSLQADRQRPDSIGRTVLQTVVQKGSFKKLFYSCSDLRNQWSYEIGDTDYGTVAGDSIYNNNISLWSNQSAVGSALYDRTRR